MACRPRASQAFQRPIVLQVESCPVITQRRAGAHANPAKEVKSSQSKPFLCVSRGAAFAPKTELFTKGCPELEGPAVHPAGSSSLGRVGVIKRAFSVQVPEAVGMRLGCALSRVSMTQGPGSTAQGVLRWL